MCSLRRPIIPSFLIWPRCVAPSLLRPLGLAKCAVYAPLYRQATIGTYFAGKDRRESFLQTAYSDVLDAFLHYMGQHNRGRKVVLIGHSQGADMISRLLRQVFDHDPAMRERLMLAMPVGDRSKCRTGSSLADR